MPLGPQKKMPRSKMCHLADVPLPAEGHGTTVIRRRYREGSLWEGSLSAFGK